VPRTFNAEPILLPRSSDVPVLPLLPAEPYSRPMNLFPFKLEWESRDDQPLLEK
jgi:hypothetical protein